MADLKETTRVVWYTPTDYDALQHGPPYLPNAKTAVLKQAAVAEPSALETLLACLQALAMLHQTHHWSTRGASYYADHQLFDRLYTESLPFIDSLAERAVGLSSPPSISALVQTQSMLSFLVMFGTATTSEEMVSLSLRAETFCLDLVTQTLALLESSGGLSPGTSNLLEGIADSHESFIYLLRQRGSAEYTYDRG